MKILSIIKQNFSYALRSPINLDLLKTEAGKILIQQSLAARFKPADLFSELLNRYDSFRKGTNSLRKISTNSKSLASRSTNWKKTLNWVLKFQN